MAELDITRISPMGVTPTTPQPKVETRVGEINKIGQDFKELLESLKQSQATSDQLEKKLISGEDVDIHQVMVAFEEMDINFRAAMAIRDRLVDAYREVTRIQV
jgi:flagellar hook-basal body complex protein FliE